jgi:hypothetical protein
LSDGDFSDDQQGSKTFRQFLTQYPHLLQIENEGSTLYVAPVAVKASKVAVALDANSAAGQPLAESEVADLLERALAELLTDQPRPRASLVKQRMQELSGGAFDESAQGYTSFRHFLEQFPHLLALQQTGSTLFVTRPQQSTPQADLHLHYRAYLKKQGLRVVPSEIRLQLLKDIIALLQEKEQVEWQEIVTRLATYYQARTGSGISKSFINDVLRVAQRADVISIPNNMPWTSAPVRLRLSGDRVFQNAVMRCDAAYLDCLQSSPVPFDLQTAALALYDAPTQVRYLQVVLHQGSRNGRVAGP